MTIPVLEPGRNLPPDQNFAFVTARGGHYLVRRGPWFEACVKVAENPNLPEQEEGYKFLGPKLPASLFAQILGFFEVVRIKHGTEAAALLVFEGGRWSAVVPEQQAGGASVRYNVCPGVRPAGSIHSHPGFSAQFSQTDRKDEAQFDGIHIVVADSGFIRPEVSVAAVVAGRRIDLDPEDVIEGFDAVEDFPEDWLGRVAAEKEIHLLQWPAQAAHEAGGRGAHPLCGACWHADGCTLEVPEVGKSCLFFEPGGMWEGLP
jgi:hypothetical protein